MREIVHLPSDMAIISSKQPASDAQQPQKERKNTTPKKIATPTQLAPVDTEILQAEITNTEEKIQEETLRPSSIKEYIGQKDLKGVLDIAIQAAKVRQESLDHLLQNHHVPNSGIRNGCKLQDYGGSSLGTSP
jgi:holliday junction DNA helicase RuvB